MSDQDDLADLEAERDRLRSLIAYCERPDIGFPELPTWFCYILAGIVGIVGVVVAADMLEGEIDPSLVIFAVVFVTLTAYISTRKINAFGARMRVFDLVSYLALSVFPGPKASDLRQRLSKCESKIMEMKERRP
jgi:hypothetical protein